MENQVTVTMQSQKDPAVWACHRTVETDCPCSRHQLVIHSAKLYYMCHGARVDRNNTCFWQSLPGRRIILNGKKREKPVEKIYIYYLYTYIFITWGTLWIFGKQKHHQRLSHHISTAEPGMQSLCQGKKIEPSAKATGVLANGAVGFLLLLLYFSQPAFSKMEIE